MAVKVSVVVPVYNAGPLLGPTVRSVLEQTMPPEDLELVAVDDGSTDDSWDRLQALAAEHPQVRAFTIPHSGWPGRPRNVGTEAARGEYVMYLDQDDRLEPEAMQRMYDLGVTGRADIVLPKVISDFRGVHHRLYRETATGLTIENSRLIHSQTPHKMLRTEFLRQHRIRFAEGPRRLEDQLFITQAYFAASSAAVDADYVGYRYQRRPDGGNAGSQRGDPAAYYGNLEEVLDVVEAHTEPGPDRDRLLRRFLRTEMLGRTGGRRLLVNPRAHSERVLELVADLMERRFDPGVDDGLGGLLRVRARLTRGRRLEDLYALARRSQSVGVRPVVRERRLVAPERGRGWGVELDVEVRVQVGPDPLALERGSAGWSLPAALAGPGLPDTVRRVAVEELEADLMVRHRESLDEWFVPGDLHPAVETVGDHGEAVFRGRVRLDPDRVAGGRPLRPGKHDLVVRAGIFGISRQGRLVGSQPALVLVGRTPARLAGDRRGGLTVEVGPRRRLVKRALRAAEPVPAGPEELVLDLGTVWRRVPAVTAELAREPRGWPTRTVRLRPANPPGTRWTARGLSPGTYRATLSVTQPNGSAQTVSVDRAVSVAGSRSPVAGARRAARRALRGAAARLRAGRQ